MLRDQIAELEADIEDLSQAAERCRKIGIAAQVLMAGGAFLLMLAVLGLWRLGPAALVTSLAAILGGIALYGSNKRTRDDTMAAIRAKEADRAALIDALRAARFQALSHRGGPAVA
jgi:O-antigen ligase